MTKEAPAHGLLSLKSVRTMLSFTLNATSGAARAGTLTTAHGVVQTPAFMPVGTQATVKALGPDDLRDARAQIVLANTYHLMLRPGIDLIERGGGLHQFMAWDRPILTDSGGFQVFSLGHLRKLTADEVRFRSHIDGSEHVLTPELAVEYQERLGSDIAMVLDHCPAYGPDASGLQEVETATERTHRWAERCLKARRRQDQALFGIVQGGWFPDLRRASAEFLASLDFLGYAIGGVSVGEPARLAYEAAEVAAGALPAGKPRYLMGVGSPEDLVQCVARGIDMFDCVMPTRVARNGGLYTRSGRVSIRNARFRDQETPVEEGCDCYTCRTFSAAYLHHLFRAGELLYYRLGTLHNVRFLTRLMEQARQAILERRYAAFAQDFLRDYQPADEQTRLEQKDRWLAARRARTDEDQD